MGKRTPSSVADKMQIKHGLPEGEPPISMLARVLLNRFDEPILDLSTCRTPAEVLAALGGQSSVSFAGSKTIYVSKGANATDTRTGLSAYDANRPFATLTAAQAVSVSGDTIVVYPGTYNETNLGKDGVNWFGFPGADVVYTGATTGGLFQDGGASKTFSVTWNGLLNQSGNGNTQSILAVTNASSSIRIQGVQCISTGQGVRIEAGTAYFIADSLTTSDGSIDSISNLNNATTIARIREINSAGYVVECDGGTLDVICDTATSTSSEAVLFTGSNPGIIRLVARRISAPGDVVAVYSGADTCSVKISDSEIIASNPSETQYAIQCGDSLTLKNCRISVTENANNRPAIEVYGPGLVLDACVIVADTGAASSINAGSAQTIKVYGSTVANKAVDGDITQQVGTVLVDANVT